MLELLLTVFLLVAGILVAVRVCVGSASRFVVPPSVAKLPCDEEVRKLESEVSKKADSVLQTLSGVMNELHADEARHDVSESDTMRSISRKVDELDRVAKTSMKRV